MFTERKVTTLRATSFDSRPEPPVLLTLTCPRHCKPTPQRLRRNGHGGSKQKTFLIRALLALPWTPFDHAWPIAALEVAAPLALGGGSGRRDDRRCAGAPPEPARFARADRAHDPELGRRRDACAHASSCKAALRCHGPGAGQGHKVGGQILPQGAPRCGQDATCTTTRKCGTRGNACCCSSGSAGESARGGECGAL